MTGATTAAVDTSGLPLLPPDWRYESVGALGQADEQAVLTGPFGTNLGRSDFVEKGVPVLTIGCLTGGGITLDKALYITEEKARQLERYRLREGDLLFSRMASVGRAGMVPKSLAGALFNYHIMRLRLDESRIDPRVFINYVRGARQVRDYLKAVNHGATREGINTEQLLGLPVAVPPVSKQREIVAEIEKQFSRLNDAVDNLKRVKDKLRRYKAAVLKAAVEGRLVSTEAERSRYEGRGYETGEQFLGRVLQCRRDNWNGKGRYKEPIVIDTANLGKLPEGWVWASVDQLLGHVTDGDHQPPPQTESGIPFLVIGNVNTGELDFADTRFVSEGYYQSLDSSRRPQEGDLLFTLVGSYGIPVRVKVKRRFCVQRHIAILRPHALSPMEYLAVAMSSDLAFRQATDVATGTAQLTVPLAGLRGIALPLPPAIEQERIVAEVARRLSIAGDTETEIASNLMRAHALRYAVLGKQFGS